MKQATRKEKRFKKYKKDEKNLQSNKETEKRILFFFSAPASLIRTIVFVCTYVHF